jgi:hypothetical protein
MRLLLGLLMAVVGSVPQVSPPAETDEILALLSKLHVDKTQIYNIRDITIRRDVLSISFNRGTIAFLEPVVGRVIGAVFIGSGELVAIPPDPIEKQQLYKFTGSPLLNQPFSAAILRFTDGTYEEIMKEHAQRAEEEVSSEDSAQVLSWDQSLSSYSAVMNYRILSDFIAPSAPPMFFAELNGEKTGPFEVVFDPRSVEEVAIFKIHETTGSTVADLWASFNQRSDARNPEVVAHEDKAVVDILTYEIDASVSTANQLVAKTTMRVKGLLAGERVLNFRLSHLLRVSSVSLDSGEPVSFYQEAGTNIVTIVMPRGLQTGEEVLLQFAYAGDATDKREPWYPNSGYQDRATFNLTFHFPKEVTLIATGNKVREWEENGLQHSTWKSDGEFPVAVFRTGASVLDPGDITYFTGVAGPYPYTQLKVLNSAQADAQSWPGLIELPSGDESATELARAQAIARQWFGNSIGMASYHDQWLMEGLARYFAAMYIDTKYPDARRLHEILAEARSHLFEQEPDGSINEDAGPISLGERLSTTVTPTGYRAAYNKGVWVVHMLRMLMRQNSANPDDAFLKMIREFVENYKEKNASTWDFKRLAEKYMTSALDLRGDAKLDWFFDEWVFATGIPTYSLDYKVEPVRNAFIVSGTIKRTGVSDNFTMPIPLYGDDVFLGRVPVGDSEESFRFQVTKKPERVVIDPQETILTRP